MKTLLCLFVLLFASLVMSAPERVITANPAVGKTEWGTYHAAILCPNGINVIGYRLKLGKPTDSDKIGVSGIQLACADGTSTGESANNLGEWAAWQYCGTGADDPTSFVTGYKYASQEKQGGKDDQGATNVQMKCSNGKELVGAGSPGDGTSDTDDFVGCSLTTSLCGVQVEIEPVIRGDDTAVNRMRFLCCSFGELPAATEPCVRTTGGNVDEATCCVTPFTYNGQTHNGCITTDRNRPWCSTTADYDVNQKWGFCQVQKDSLVNYTRLASEVCVGVQKQDFGFFNSPEEGFLSSVKLLHKHGYVTCHANLPQASSHFGCNLHHVFGEFGIYVTGADNLIILPKNVVHRHTFYSLPSNDPLRSKTMTLYDNVSPSFISKGEEIRVWYGEDLRNSGTHDNGFGRACYDVYAQFLS